MNFLARMCFLALLALPLQARAQMHHHEGASPEVDKFYSTWMKPDAPGQSCCNKIDCYATQVMFRDGRLYGQRREDGKWLLIPASKVEMNRDNPDGNNHLCAPPPDTSYGDSIFYFSLGSGT